MTLLSTFTLLALVSTTEPAVQPARDCGRMRGQSTHSDGSQTTIVLSDDDRCLAVRIAGTVALTDDDADVASLGSGGTMELDERRGGTRRTLLLAERGGRIERQYDVNGVSRPADESAAWLRAALLDLVRSTALGAEARVARIHRQRGADGVLDEVGRLRSDHVRRVYLERLLTLDLSNDEARRVATAAGDRISSDHDRSEVLRSVVAERGGDDRVADAVARAASRMGSDHDRARVLLALVERGVPVAADARRAFFEAVDRMGSDHNRRQVLEAIAARDAADPASIRALLASAARMGSDHDKASVLLAVAARPERLRDRDTRAAFDAAVRSIGSDSDYRRVMSVVAR